MTESRATAGAPTGRKGLTIRLRKRLVWEARLETGMILLGFAWLLLLITEFAYRPTPLLETLSTAIWIIFLIEFMVKFFYASRKVNYLKKNWVAGFALLLPAFRVFRIFHTLRILRLTSTMRGLRLVRLITSFNRGMKALGSAMGRHGIGYVAFLTTLVTLAGAAGMYAFEKDSSQGQGITDFGTALWWTSMLMTTMGSEYWPKTVEGRVLCVLLALYAFSVFGYVTATLASFLVGRDASNPESATVGSSDVKDLRDQIIYLQEQMQRMESQLKILVIKSTESGPTQKL